MSGKINRRLLGKQLSQLSNASVAEVLAAAPGEKPTDVPRIGLTGAPGVGKSTLAAQLGTYRAEDHSVGILAVDPSSPISGGAILGDRIRLDELRPSHDLYMRSVASRSVNDGLADNLPELLEAMAAAGFDELLLETVGVGQAEHGARSQVDTLVLVLMPDSGDTIQAMKAGSMELADIYVINKSDLPGADKLAAEIRRVHAYTAKRSSWESPVVLTSMSESGSIKALSDAIDQHQAWLRTTHTDDEIRAMRARYRLKLQLERRIKEVLDEFEPADFTKPIAEQYLSAVKKLEK